MIEEKNKVKNNNQDKINENAKRIKKSELINTEKEKSAKKRKANKNSQKESPTEKKKYSQSKTKNTQKTLSKKESIEKNNVTAKKASSNKERQKKVKSKNQPKEDSFKIKNDKKENLLSKTISIPISAIKSKINNTSSNKKPESEAVRLYKKKKERHERKKRRYNGRISFDILSLLILIVAVVCVSCLLTAFLINYQFKKSTNLIDRNVVTDKNVQDFLNTYSEIVENYYEEIDKEGMMASAMSGMLSYLEDNYSIFLNADDSESLSESLDGSYNGLGILIRGTTIEEVYKNSPAEKAGLQKDDILTKVNDNDINLENYDDIANYLNKEGENNIVVKRGKEEIAFQVEVSSVYIPATSNSIIKSPDKKKNIGYINLSTFSLLAYEDFKSSLEEIEKEGMDSLIIDLRNNTGGYLDVAENIANLFLEKDKIIYSLEKKNQVSSYKDKSDEKREYQIVVLVNGGTASASEILASALHDSYGATIVGNKTYGKGKVQTMKYYEGKVVKYTSAKWLRPNGECIDEIGIIPDYEISLQIEDDAIYDKQLDKAIELLSK